MKTLRIFISSPGDVRHERYIAQKVISDLNKIYKDYVMLEAIIWEDLPLEATLSFQDGINYFLQQEPIDIAIFILWSRLGTALSSSFQRPDGTIYASGTEYEFDMMYSLWEQTSKPKIMVYVKDAEIEYNTVLSSSAMREILDQKERLNHFIEEKFKDRETGTNYAYWQFQKQQTFEERLKTHLTRLIKEHIGYDISVREWDGNPYVGLRAFEMSESSIYCGRKNIIYDISHKIFSLIESNQFPTLIVSGESGSGKSSFIKAGLLPHVIEGNTNNIVFDVKNIKPSLFHGDFYQGLVDILLNHYPNLNNHPVRKDLRDGIAQDYDFKYLVYAISNYSNNNRLVLYLDQFEELFTDASISVSERQKVIHLIRGISETQQILLIMSLRSDYYRDFASYEDLLTIKKEALWVDIPKMSISDWTEIVEEPARKANLRWEINEQGVSLKKQIIQEATELKNLPLLEFALSKLYEESAQDGLITFEEYNKIGKLEGAIEQYANLFYDQLSEEEQRAFMQILSGLLTVSNNNKRAFIRKTPLLKDIATTPIKANVIQKAVDAHLLITDKNVKNNAIVTLSHENLISGWSRIREWTTANTEYLQKSNYYEKLAGYWKGHNCSKKDLLQSKTALLEAEYFMYHHEHETTPLIHDFLNNSLVRHSRKGLTRFILYLFGVILLSLGICIIMINNTSGDKDLDTFFSINDISLNSVVLILFPLFTLTIYNIYVKIKARYKYKNIISSIVVWSCVIGVMLLCIIYGMITKTISGFEWIWFTIFLLCGGNSFLEIRRRIKWRENKFIPYFFADRFETIKNIVLGSFVGVSVLLIITMYGVFLNEKNERYENTLKITDDLFDGLNNTSRNLSWGDQLYINRMRINYLYERWKDDLADTIPDKREGQLATCYYNLKEPNKALAYLYPDYYWADHCLYVCASMQLGRYSIVDFLLDDLVAHHKVFSLNKNYISATHYIMIAEMIGRFDLADSIFAQMKESELTWDVNEYVNYGHIKLMQNKIDSALYFYDLAHSVLNESNNDIYNDEKLSKIITTNVGNDLHLFQWLNVGNQQSIQMALKKMNIPQRQFYTSSNDTMAESYRNRLVGKWMLKDSTITMTVFEKYSAIQYIFRDINCNEKSRTITNYRLAERDNNLYIEELDQEACYVSVGKIIQLSDDMLAIQIIENGDVNQKNTIREYYRVSE